MLNASAFVVSLVTGPNEIFAQSCLRPDNFTLLCLAPAGASSELEVKVAVAGVSSRPPLVSFAVPVVTNVSTQGYLLTVSGLNLGSNASDGSPSLEQVELMAAPGTFDGDGSGLSRCARITYAPCGLQPAAALACTYVVAQAQVLCALDPEGFGVGLLVRVVVGGQVSAWSAAAVAYPPPVIASVTPVLTAPSSPGTAVTRTGVACDGGTRVVVAGSGFVAGGPSVVNVSVGGVAISLAKVTFLYNSAAVFDRARLASALGVTQAFVGALELSMPPGFGSVEVLLTIGNRTAVFLVPYENPVLTNSSISWRDGDVTTATRSINLLGVGFAPCALCLDSRSSSLAAWASASAPCAGVPFRGADVACALPPQFLGNASGQAPGVVGVSVAGNFSADIVAHDWSADGTVMSLTFTDPATTDRILSGELVISFAGAVMLAETAYDFAATLLNNPVLTSVSPTTWSNMGSGQATLVSIALSFAGADGGTVLLTTDSTDPTGGFQIECPTIWTTLITRTDAVFPPASAGPVAASAFSLATASPPSKFATGAVTIDLSGQSVALATCVASAQCAADFAVGPGILLSDSIMACVNCIVSAGGLQQRLLWNYNPPSWLLSPFNVPCFVASWKGLTGIKSVAADKDQITFYPPPWQGTVTVQAVAVGSTSKASNEQLAVYATPVITALVSSSPDGLVPTRGGLVTLSGTDFGPAASVGFAWAALNGSSIASYWPSSSSHAPASSSSPAFGLNKVTVQYASSVTVRPCAVESWSSTSITCFMPVGAPGSTNTAVASQFDPASGQVSIASNPSTAAVRYALPSLNSVVTVGNVSANTVGGYELTILGGNFSNSSECALNSSSSTSSQWSASVSLCDQAASMPCTGGQANSDLIVSSGLLNLVSLDHERLVISLAAAASPTWLIEGTVVITATFLNKLDPNEPAVLGSVALVVAPPVITSVAVVAAAGSYDDDPCRALAVSHNVSESGSFTSVFESDDDALTAALANASLATQSLFRPGDTCVQSIREQGISTTFRLQRSKPCFRASNSSTGSKTVLQITGFNFGSGTSPTSKQNVSVTSLANIKVVPVFCVAITDPTATVVINDGQLLCELQNDVVLGPTVITVFQAFSFSTTLQSEPPLTPYAACRCGSYAVAEGQLCVACPVATVSQPAPYLCAGRSDPARAAKDHWKTVPAEWGLPALKTVDGGFGRAIPLINVDLLSWLTVTDSDPRWSNSTAFAGLGAYSTVGKTTKPSAGQTVALFVPCISNGMCGADNKCVESTNSQGFMCVECMAGMRRGTDGITCAVCDPASVNETAVVIAVIVFSLAFLAFAVKPLLARLAPAPAKLDARAQRAKERWEQNRLANDDTAPLMLYLRIAITFVQTLSALSLYVDPTQPAFKNQQPSVFMNFLSSFSVVREMGLNVRGIQCMIGEDSNTFQY